MPEEHMNIWTALWRAAVIVFLMTISYAGGEIRSNHATRILRLELEQERILISSETKDMRLNSLEIGQATLMSDTISMKKDIARIDRALERADNEDEKK